MQKIKFHSDYIDQIPKELQTNNMLDLYNYLYDLQKKNRPQNFKKLEIQNGVNLNRINRLGFIVKDNYTLSPLTKDDGAVTIFFSTDCDYKQLCLKYNHETKTVDNPYEIETKILFKNMNQMDYQALEFTKKDDDLTVFFYKNQSITPELIELREYLKENNFEYMRLCGSNNPYPEFDAFDWGIFVDYKINTSSTHERLYGYEIQEPLKSKLKAIPMHILLSDLFITPDPELDGILNVFDLDHEYDSENKSYINNTFYKML